MKTRRCVVEPREVRLKKYGDYYQKECRMEFIDVPLTVYQILAY